MPGKKYQQSERRVAALFQPLRLATTLLLLTTQTMISRAWRGPSTTFLRRTTASRIRKSPYFTSTIRFPPPHRTTSSVSTSRLFAKKRSSSSSKSENAAWQVGDKVLIDVHKDQSKILPAVIEEIRKAGWYSVRYETSPDEIQKVRKSQLLQQRQVPMESGSNDDEITVDTSAIPADLVPVQEPVQAIPAMTIDVDTPPKHPVNSDAPPPPPKMDNLDALLKELEQDESLLQNNANATHKEYLQQLQHHASIRHWVVFTDLHCAPSTLTTTQQVLQRVHQLARERNAGVLFLGDFWHHRGTLRVDCLNAVLQEFREWTVPMILIPGNHDQVTLGGHSHGLTPLENAYRVATTTTSSVPGPLVLSHPTLLAGALFVPHVRDIATLESILQTDMAKEHAKCIFVHADVTGAYMNDLIVSTGGIHPSAFPPNKPIYSGHFHKPHTVTSQKLNVEIEYLGSPYETSLAEAYQAKALVVLDATEQWKCIERIPLSIGRKHYKPHSVPELMALRLDDDANDKKATLVRQGDRIVASLPHKDFRELEEEDVEDHIRELRKGGVAVELREDSNINATVAAVASADAPDLEHLSPISTWERFWEEQVERGVMELEAAVELKEAGVGLLEQIDEDGQSSVSSTSDSSLLSTAATNLQFDSVSVEGYGPFPKRVDYPLNDRGLVLLRGSNMDGGSDSNGSGKTSLAMAALWALTGSADPRPVQDSKVSDVANDSNQNARVTVYGHVNGNPFSITRTKTPKKSGLAFILDGEDITTQSVKETMELVEEKLGVSGPVLARTMFHGQHALNELLEATDAKLKDELSLIVPLELWQAAATLARSNGREANKKENELDGMSSLRMGDMDKFKARCATAAADLNEKEQTLRTKEAHLEAHKTQQRNQSGDEMTKEPALEILRERIEDASAHVDATQTQLRSLATERDSELERVSKRLSQQMMSAKEATEAHQKLQFEFQSSTHTVDTLQNQIEGLETVWQCDLSAGALPTNFEAPDTCPTCLQPVPKSNGVTHPHDHQNMQAKAEGEIKETLDALTAAKARLSSAKDTLETATHQKKEFDESVVLVQEELKGKTTYWEEQLSSTEKELAQYQEQVAEMTNSFTSKAEKLQEATILESRLESEVMATREAARFAKDSHKSLNKELKSMSDAVAILRGQIKEAKGRSRQMSSLADAFGNRGVQTFVLQNAVKDLQSLTQKYLDDFSDGAQRLELSLDAGDKISRQALVREPDGSFRERPLASLSGGQWRRCSLALSLGFADLVATRGGLRPSLIVLDEPLTHLDRAGRSDVGKVLRKILGRSSDKSSPGYANFSVSTIVIILQDLAAEELEEAFDRIDEVVKQNGASYVKVDERADMAS